MIERQTKSSVIENNDRESNKLADAKGAALTISGSSVHAILAEPETDATRAGDTVIGATNGRVQRRSNGERG